MATTIGFYYLIDRGAFDVKAEINYTTSGGLNGTTPSYGTLMAGQAKTIDPSVNGVEDGWSITLKCDVVLGKDKTAAEAFTYSNTSTACANYSISGTTLFDTLTFLGITTAPPTEDRP